MEKNISYTHQSGVSKDNGTMEKLEFKGMLYDFYGELLTEHQNDYNYIKMLQRNARRTQQCLVGNILST